MVQSDHHERGFQDEYLGRKLHFCYGNHAANFFFGSRPAAGTIFNGFRELLKNSSPHHAVKTAEYHAHYEFFHAMSRILFEIAGRVDHVRT
ncbi:MAG: hypothetical protein DMG99_07540 [Acidobacteria bacterium]|nr:MAG: hypothetical protein DMG99_07540 [Acidobacteriota bacterium]